MSQSAKLEDRGVIRVSGAEAVDFLQGLVTCDMDAVQGGKPSFGALLTPQGKILFDFHIRADEKGFLLDCRADIVDDFIKRLTFYKLRAQVDIENLSQTHSVIAIWGDDDTSPPEGFAEDPRLAALGRRAIVAADAIETLNASLADYHAHRIALGVPEGEIDFAFGEAFPHETDMDQLNGVSFSKGCYVGQEVVSRMENRSTARTRTILATSNGDIPPAGAKIEAAGKTIGTLGSSANGKAIAIVRLDRLEKARANNDPIFATNIPLELKLPEWANFSTPDTENA